MTTEDVIKITDNFAATLVQHGVRESLAPDVAGHMYHIWLRAEKAPLGQQTVEMREAVKTIAHDIAMICVTITREQCKDLAQAFCRSLMHVYYKDAMARVSASDVAKKRRVYHL